MNRSWFLFYGRRCGMSTQEIMHTRLGEMTDMISCLSIYEGGAKYKPPKPSYADVMKMR